MKLSVDVVLAVNPVAQLVAKSQLNGLMNLDLPLTNLK